VSTATAFASSPEARQGQGCRQNRLRLADAPTRSSGWCPCKDALSHAYELLKVRTLAGGGLAAPVASGGLSWSKLRARIDVRPRVRHAEGDEAALPVAEGAADEIERTAGAAWAGGHTPRPLTDDSLVAAKQSLAEAIESIVDVIRDEQALESIGSVDRVNLAKYLTIAKLRLENAIAVVRSGEPHE
jgi:hypothetical protein